MEKTSLNDFEWIDIKTSSKHTVFADFPCASAQREFDISLVMLNNLWPTVQLALADKKTDGTHTLGVQLGVLMAITDTIITLAITLISWDTTSTTMLLLYIPLKHIKTATAPPSAIKCLDAKLPGYQLDRRIHT